MDLEFVSSRGKGIHGEIRLGPYRTTAPRGEIPSGTLAAMLKNLHIDRRELQVVRYVYPCCIARDEKEERASGKEAYTVAFPDVYGANTGGWSWKEAMERAKDCLAVALGMYVKASEDIPVPSAQKEGQVLIFVPPILASKLALYQTMREQGVSVGVLAECLGLQEKAVLRLLDPGHQSPMTAVERALEVMGRSLMIEDRATVQ